MNSNFSFIIIGLLFILTAIFFKSSKLQEKKIFYLSFYHFFQQFIFLPIVFLLLLNFSFQIIISPQIKNLFLTDLILIIGFFTCLLITIVGLAIHTISKTYSIYLKKFGDKNEDIFNLNNFFHMRFSHNLIYSFGILSAFFLSLMEISHQQSYYSNNLIVFLSGLLIGLASGKSINWYKESLNKSMYFLNSVILLVLAVSILNFEKNYIYQNPLYFIFLIGMVVIFLLTIFFPFINKKILKTQN